MAQITLELKDTTSIPSGSTLRLGLEAFGGRMAAHTDSFKTPSTIMLEQAVPFPGHNDPMEVTVKVTWEGYVYNTVFTGTFAFDYPAPDASSPFFSRDVDLWNKGQKCTVSVNVSRLLEPFNTAGDPAGVRQPSSVQSHRSKDVICVLSIDGGGIRGIIPTMLLSALEHATGMPTNQLFDLAAGTSTGGLVAVGLTHEKDKVSMTADEILVTYIKEGTTIFPQPSVADKLVSLFYSSTYTRKGLDTVLRNVVGKEARLQENNHIPVTVSTYDMKAGETRFFKSWRKGERHEVSKMFALQCTTAAPTYFNPPEAPSGYLQNCVFVDGGVAANNPVLKAYLCALDYYGEPCDKCKAGSLEMQKECEKKYPSKNQRYHVVSLGTGEPKKQDQPWITVANLSKWGKLEWILPNSLHGGDLMNRLMTISSDTADSQVKSLVSHGYYRFQHQITTASHDMDDATPENLAKLLNEGARLVKDKKDQLRDLATVLTGTSSNAARNNATNSNTSINLGWTLQTRFSALQVQD